ncbi:sensor histidine kinase [Protaetiibacter intestinalis]|uniref:histidine kinase n=1 Tax=Protaetiibacter intestinalis TaxID=2419774 RepID=A0A387B9W2_9MICO|nr:histidine kinase [Protaetiibacter intestinalis]AYF97729.1 sensor histidine kinase [Protaetiibacter intestinalis]
MAESLTSGLAIAVAVALLAVAGYLLARRFARGPRELGTEAERTRFTTLHLATRAAEHLRAGLEGGDTVRAARDLRAMLDCDALALSGADGVLAVDGPAALREVAEGVVRAHSGLRPQLHRAAAGQGREALDAVSAPILRSGIRAGTLVAFARGARPGLVRATGEAARWVSTQLELAELDASRAALAEAEVKALRAQISPHFIYNALTAIASFIHTDPAKARELVVEFADFTRYSFRRHGDFTTVAEELRSVDGYLRLERARFGDRLEVTLQIAPELLATIIPFLSVQPLVENAVRHGLESAERGGRVTITATDAGSCALITVEDDGVGIDPELARAVLAGRAGGEHVGLRNVDTRLRQVYGDDFGLVVETNVGAGTLVTMRVPKSQPLRAGEERLAG